MNIKFSNWFIKNTEKMMNPNLSFYNFKSMNDTELSAFTTFLWTVIRKEKFCGTNKKSHYTKINQVQKICEEFNIWHCHFNIKNCQSPCQKLNCFSYAFCQKEHTGQTSAEIVHYCYSEEKNEIYILAYSKFHNPFPSLLNNKIRTSLNSYKIDPQKQYLISTADDLLNFINEKGQY